MAYISFRLNQLKKRTLQNIFISNFIDYDYGNGAIMLIHTAPDAVLSYTRKSKFYSISWHTPFMYGLTCLYYGVL